MAQSNEHTTVEMNRTICEFMGWKFKQDGDDWFNAYHEGQLMWADDGKFVNKVLVVGFNYHEDWNKLMPVVEKIEQLNDDVVVKIYTSINGKSCFLWNYFDVKGLLRPDSELNCPFSQRYTGKTKIEATHKAIYQFITWFNQQKQNNGTEK